MKIKNILLINFTFFLLVACSDNIIKVVNDTPINYKPKYKLQLTDTAYTIFIGDRINPLNISSQIALINDTINYIILDENFLYFFNLKTGNKLFKIKIDAQKKDGCGILNNYSGFLYHNKDSIFIYNYVQKKVYLINNRANVSGKWNTKNKSLAKYPVDAEALNYSPILYFNNKIILSGSSLGQPDDATYSNKPVSCVINLINSKLSYFCGYPNQYREGNFGGVYFNQINHTLGKDNLIIYSFPADHFLYVFSDFSLNYEKFYAGSKYIKSIHSSSMSPIDIFLDKNKRIEYFISQPSYGRIIYNKYADIYYRIAYLPLTKWTPDKITFTKPFSIIILDHNMNEIYESEIFDNPDDYNLYNAHVVPEGLIIQKTSKNENIIQFDLFRIQKIQ